MLTQASLNRIIEMQGQSNRSIINALNRLALSLLAFSGELDGYTNKLKRLTSLPTEQEKLQFIKHLGGDRNGFIRYMGSQTNMT